MESVAVACVLKSGGEYRPEHVHALRKQFAQYAPYTPFFCLSDIDFDDDYIPLEYDLKGWWSKLEVCRPDICGEAVLLVDLDTVVIGDIAEILSVRQFTMLRDFYRPYLAQSGIMCLTNTVRANIWDHFSTHRKNIMANFRGDGEYLNTFYGAAASRWQDLLPGQIVSYKAHVRGKSIPADARIVCFHGRPRPWDVELRAA